MARWLPVCILLATVQLSFAQTAWYDYYTSGLEALLKRGDPASAVPPLRQACLLRPEPALRINTVGNTYIQYLPNFYLGKALFLTGRYQEALNAFTAEERYGQIQKVFSSYEELKSMRQQAVAKLTGTTIAPPPPPTEQPPPLTPEEAELAKRKRIERYLASGYKALAEKKYSSARDSFKRVLLLDPNDTESQEALSKIAAAEEAATLEQASTKEMTRKGVRAFLDGRYADAREALDVTLQRDPACSVCRFFLGCSYAALYLLSGEKDTDSLGRAQAQFQQFAKNDPNYTPDPNLIPPRIAEIYRRALGK